MNNKKLYFIAIPTPTEITKKIRTLQEIFKSDYNAKRQLKIPVHITLIPPFTATNEQRIKLEKIIKNFMEQLSSFNVELDGFGHFRKSVIYVRVKRNNELISFYERFLSTIQESNLISLPKMHKEFQPHITLANRDLTKNQFNRAWSEFEDKKMKEQFQFTKIVLYEHNGKIWQSKKRFFKIKKAGVN